MQLDFDTIERTIAAALEEDIGKGDITSELVIPEDATAHMAFVAREALVVCGLPVIEQLFKRINDFVAQNPVEWMPLVEEGSSLDAGKSVARIQGNARAILSAERVALNILQHMCGIATLTRKFVDAINGTPVTLLDTRKTLPGLRMLEKYAVSVGGAQNHRLRLDDGILIKDNHIRVAGGVGTAVRQAKSDAPKDMPVEVECETIDQVKEAILAQADILLLDNMDIATIKEVVSLVDGKAKLEASGGVTLDNVHGVANTGVDYISIGALTHSSPAVDIALDPV